jgi:hypothetical protein
MVDLLLWTYLIGIGPAALIAVITAKLLSRKPATPPRDIAGLAMLCGVGWPLVAVGLAQLGLLAFAGWFHGLLSPMAKRQAATPQAQSAVSSAA